MRACYEKKKYHQTIRVTWANFGSVTSDVLKLYFELKFKFMDNVGMLLKKEIPSKDQKTKTKTKPLTHPPLIGLFTKIRTSFLRLPFESYYFPNTPTVS